VYVISVLSFLSSNPNTLNPDVFVTTTSEIIGYTLECHVKCERRSWKNEAFSNAMLFSSGALGSAVLTKYYSGKQIKKNEMGGTCGTYGELERCIQGSGGENGGNEANWKT
jgi:hypothetical protein